MRQMPSAAACCQLQLPVEPRRYREVFYSRPYILALYNLQGCNSPWKLDGASWGIDSKIVFVRLCCLHGPSCWPVLFQEMFAMDSVNRTVLGPVEP